MKRCLLFLALAVVIILMVVGRLVVSGGRAGPSYQGKSLETWLADFGPLPIRGGLIHERLSNPRRQPQLGPPGVAIRAMGTNVLEPLLRQIKQTDDQPWLATVKRVLNKQKFLKLRLRDPQTQREQAALAFYELGPAGLPALAELASLLTNYSSAACAAHALAGMGEPVIPLFAAALTNSNSWIKLCSVWGLAQIGPQSRGTVPQMLPLLQHGNTTDMRITIWALGEIHEPADVIRPELVRLLENSDPAVRDATAQALSKFGVDAKPALGEIQAALEHETDPNVRDTLTKSIKKIEQAGAALNPATPPAPP